MCCICGCSKDDVSDITPITKSFKCDFSIEGSDLNGELSVNSEGDLSIVFSGPDIINGTAIRIREESVIIDVQGAVERYARDTVPEDSPALYIYDALTATENLKPKVNNNKIYIDGDCLSGGFSAVLNGTGFITELTLHDTGTTVFFNNHFRIN